MEFVPEPPAKTLTEAFRRRVRSWLERQHTTPDQIFRQEAATLPVLLADAEDMFVLKFATFLLRRMP